MTSNRDPLQGLIDYVNAIKPFHTKIADIRVQYNHTDNVNVVITEQIHMDIHIDLFEMMNTTASENMYFSVDELVQRDVVRVTISDRTSNGGYDVPAWDIDAWSMPVEPFMYITQNVLENVNIPVIEQHSIATSMDTPTVGVQITDTISFIGAAHPTLYLYDTVGVNVIEDTTATIEGLNLIGSWDATYWDIGSIDENLNVLINL